MPSKEELEEGINEKLETDIEWSELKKDDLEVFDELVESEEFVKMVVANYAGDTAGGLTKSAVSNWAPGAGIAVLTDDDTDLMDLLI